MTPAEMQGEHPVEQQVEGHREKTDHHRCLAFVERVEGVHQHLECCVAAQADGVETPRTSSLRNASVLPVAAMRASSGSATVPSATPKTPRGNCIRRNATVSQNVGPSPSCEANTELTSTFTWVVLAAITDGPIRCRIARTPGSRQRKSA